jgi:NodT family efflux transporter outer membrane factor (OMF) lipoprotein
MNHHSPPRPDLPGTGPNRIAFLSALLAAWAVFLQGCTAVGPSFKTPEAQVEEAWNEAADERLKATAPDFGQWWQSFDDPVLNRLIDMAYKQNLPLQVAGLRILQSRARLGIAVGEQFPQQQSVGADVAHARVSKNAPNGAGANQTFQNYQVGANVAWEMDFWGKYRRGVESAEAALNASMADYDNALVSLTGEVASVYVQLRTLDERIRIAEDNVKTQRRSWEIAKVRFDAGLVSELDPAQALSLLRDTQATIPALQAQRKQTAYALSILLGMPPSDLGEILGEPGNIPTPPAEVAIGIPADLLRRRPDIRAAELQAAAQSARIGIAESLLYPSFSLLGSLGLQTSSNGGAQSGDADFSDLFSQDSVTFGIGPSFSWPVLNYGRLKNNVRVEDARLQQLLVNYRDTVLTAAGEVEDAAAGFLGAQQTSALLEQGVTSAKRAVELAGIQYRDGAVDYTRVLNTQEFLLKEQDRETAARGEIALNLVGLYKALGGGWQIRADDDYVPAAIQDQMRKRTDWGKLLPPAPRSGELPKPPAGGEAQPLFGTVDW